MLPEKVVEEHFQIQHSEIPKIINKQIPVGIYRSKLTIETLEQGVKYVQS